MTNQAEIQRMWRGKRVLVTGGTGFVGSHIIDELLKRDALVRVPVHKRPSLWHDKRVECIPCDLSRYEDCLHVTKGSHIVIHAAGSVGAAGVGPERAMAGITTNLVLTSQMLQAAWASGVEKFLLFGSSTGYPVVDHPVKEDEMWSGPTHPSYFGYGWMRRYLEKMGEYVASQADMGLAIVRPTAVYGPRDNFDPASSHVIPALIRRAAEKEDPYVVWGTGKEVRDFLHVRDLAVGCMLALEKCANSDPVNIGYGKGVTISEVVSEVLKAAGHDRARLIFDASKPTAIPFRMVDITKARTLLGFEPAIRLEDGIRETVEWYKGQGKCK
jgi:GDP-L-fucose synthase